MPPKPDTNRYSSAKAKAARVFVGRSLEAKIFWEAVRTLRDERRFVLRTFYGPGGQGKTALCNELYRQSTEKNEKTHDIISTKIDLHTNPPQGRLHALLSIRNAIARVTGAIFPCFDLAYADYWSQTNPGTPPAILGSQQLSPTMGDVGTSMGDLVSDIASQGAEAAVGSIGDVLLDGLSSIPILGPVLRRTTNWAVAKGYEEYLVRNHRALSSLYAGGRRPPLDQISAHLPDLLAHELSLHLGRKNDASFILFIDEYEATMPGGGTKQRTKSDPWDSALRDFVKCAAGGEYVDEVAGERRSYEAPLLLMIFGREPLNWQEIEDGWENDFAGDAQHPLDGLTPREGLRYLKTAEVDDTAIRRQIVASAGVGRSDSPRKLYPLLLYLSVQIYFDILANGGRPSPKDFVLAEGGYKAKRMEILNRLMRNYYNVVGLEPMLRRLSCATEISRELAADLAHSLRIPFDPHLFETLLSLSFMSRTSHGSVIMHEHIADTFRSTLLNDDLTETHQFLKTWFRKRSIARNSDEIYSVDHARNHGWYIYHKVLTGLPVEPEDVSSFTLLFTCQDFLDATAIGIEAALKSNSITVSNAAEKDLLLLYAAYRTNKKRYINLVDGTVDLLNGLSATARNSSAFNDGVITFIQNNAVIEAIQDGSAFKTQLVEKRVDDLNGAIEKLSDLGDTTEPLEFDLLTTLSIFLFYLGRYSDSVDVTTRAQKLMARCCSTSHPTFAILERNKLIFERVFREKDYISKVETRADEIFREISEDKQAPFEKVEAEIKEVSTNQGRTIEEAEAYLGEALAATSVNKRHDQSKLDSETVKLGKLVLLESNHVAAVDVLELYRKNRQLDNADLATALIDHYDADLALGKGAAAPELLHQALDIYQQQPVRYRIEIIWLLERLFFGRDVYNFETRLKFGASALKFLLQPLDPYRQADLDADFSQIPSLAMVGGTLTEEALRVIQLVVNEFGNKSFAMPQVRKQQAIDVIAALEALQRRYNAEDLHRELIRMLASFINIVFDATGTVDTEYLKKAAELARQLTENDGWVPWYSVLVGFECITRNGLEDHFVEVLPLWHDAVSGVLANKLGTDHHVVSERIKEALDTPSIRRLVLHPASSSLIQKCFGILRRSEMGGELVDFFDEYLQDALVIPSESFTACHDAQFGLLVVSAPINSKDHCPALVLQLVEALRAASYSRDTSLRPIGYELGEDRFAQRAEARLSDTLQWQTVIVFELDRADPDLGYRKYFCELGYEDLLAAYEKDLLA